MHKVISVFCFAAIAASLIAAPTANEDFVVSEDAKTFTNAVNAAKAYTDEAIVSAGAVTPVIATNISGRVTSNIVNRAYVEALGVSAGLSSNEVHDIAVQATEGKRDIADLNVYEAIKDHWVWSVYVDKDDEINRFISLANKPGAPKPYYDGEYPYWYCDDISDFTFGSPAASGDEGATNLVMTVIRPNSQGDFFYVVASRLSADDESFVAVDVLAKESQIPDVANYVTKDRKVNGLPLREDITLNPALIGAYPADAGDSLQAQVTTIGAHLNAEDARFVVTNYNSVTHTPEAYVEIKLPDNSWSRIWSEMTRWNWLTGTYLPDNFYSRTEIDDKLDEKADRAWGFYDSTTGEFAPDGYTWISSPNIALAANLAYQRIVTTEGAIWVLESNGTVTEAGGMTNGFFRISDDEGNSLFEIVKGNKRTVGADASSCQTVAGFTPTKLQIGYSIVSDVHPTIYVCNSLSAHAWKAEGDADCAANVSWSGSSGAWVAQVQGKSAQKSLFVTATYEVGGETYIKNEAPVSMQHIMIGGVKYAVGTATISGHTVLTLTVAP